MNRPSIEGVPLEAFDEPIRRTLEKYSEISGGRVGFDIETAANVRLVDGKGYSARSESVVTDRGVGVGTLYIIGLAPHDGTGAATAEELVLLNTGRFPNDPKIAPRRKRGVPGQPDIHSEVSLAIAAQVAGGQDSDPIKFAGNLSLLGVGLGGDVVRIGTLGQSGSDFSQIMAGGITAEPTATLTVGNFGNQWSLNPGTKYGARHAVYNHHPRLKTHPRVVQLCGFLAITDEMAPRHLTALRDLGARLPAEAR